MSGVGSEVAEGTLRHAEISEIVSVTLSSYWVEAGVRVGPAIGYTGLR